MSEFKPIALYGCSNCHDDYSFIEEELVIYEGKTWCENCWDESDMVFDIALDWGDQTSFISEETRLITQYQEGLKAVMQHIKAVIPEGYDLSVCYTIAKKALDGVNTKDEKS